FDVRIESSSHLFIVQLSSIGGLPVLGIPMKEVSDLCEDVTHVVDESSSMTELSDRLMGAPSEFECIKLLESWVATRIASSSTNKIMEQVIAEMNKTSGNCAVSSLAKQVDLSRRHLGRLVQQEVGLSPKQLGRVIRFDRAVQLGRIRPGRSLSRIAFRSGYSDQAHMTREFRQLGGITPSAIQRDSGALIW
ncbi:MAG: helix-turn-helix domain-containing protein, partial [Planctomycetota bacterium]